MFVHCPNKATCELSDATLFYSSLHFFPRRWNQLLQIFDFFFANVWMPQIWFKDLYGPFIHFMDWLTGPAIRIQLLFFLRASSIYYLLPREPSCFLPGTSAQKSIPRRTCTPGEAWVRKGCDKLALGGNAKQRFWQQATWNPCKTAMRLPLATWLRWPRTGEEGKKAERHINTINPRWMMSWKN